MTPWRSLRVVRGNNPYQVCTLAAALTVGLALLCTSSQPSSIREAMPGVVQGAWEIGLIVAGILGLTGVAWRGRFGTALGVELAGVIILATVTTMYGIALFAVSPTAALAAGAFVVALAIGSWWRAWQIVRDLHRAARAIRDGTPLLVEEQL